MTVLSQLRENDLHRFWSQVDTLTGPVTKIGRCWVWTGNHVRGGDPQRTKAGQINLRGKVIYAHRLSYEMKFGYLDPDILVCHKCDNPPCVRPSHLFLGTHLDNVLDMRRKGRGYDIPPLRGEESPSAKLTAKEAKQCLKLRQQGLTYRQIGKRYGVSPSTIMILCKGRTWKILHDKIKR